jgi:hypothetical protein
MRIGILSCKIGVDLFVVRTRCVSEIHLAEVPLKAFPRHWLFGCGALRHRALPRVYTAILVFYGGGEPMGWRRSSDFCLALDDGVDFVTQFKDQRLTHAFPPLPVKTLRTVRKSLRSVFDIVLFFLRDFGV